MKGRVRKMEREGERERERVSLRERQNIMTFVNWSPLGL